MPSDPATLWGAIAAVALAAATGIGTVWKYLTGQLEQCEKKHEECESKNEHFRTEILGLSVRVAKLEQSTSSLGLRKE